MLLATPPAAVGSSVADARETIAEAPGNSASPAPTPRLHRRAWVFAGSGWQDAVCLTGVLDILLERLERPQLVYGSGPAALAALLASADDAFAARTAWEALRADHLLARAMLARLPLLGGVLAERCLWARSSLTRLTNSSRGPGTGLQLYAQQHYLTVDAELGATAVSKLIERALFFPNDAAGSVTDALYDAAQRGMSEVLVFAPSVLDAEAPCGQIALQVRSKGTSTLFAPLDMPTDPGPLPYLLPAMGTLERMLERGRGSASAWLAELAASGSSEAAGILPD